MNENNNTDIKIRGFSLFNSGFRIYFLGAGIIATLSMLLWSAVYLFQYPVTLRLITPSEWHAHEMIYGYSVAVISGFLLTAVKNWTGIQTVTGKLLMFLFSLWATSRILFLLGTNYLLLTGILDILYSLLLIIAISRPIIMVKQWKQLMILLVIVLLMIGNLLFYLGAFKIFDNTITLSIFGGVYLVIGLILFMGRRVVPFFIEKGVGYPVNLFNSKPLDILILITFFLFFISVLFIDSQRLTAILALVIFLMNALRLIGWHTPGIWSKSLLWSLYLAFWFITLGFLLLAGSYFIGIAKSLAVHSFTVGGIGLITLAMMSRISLGHTGHEVSHPPSAVKVALGVMVLAMLFRVLIPLVTSSHYIIWVGVSQLLWVISFIIFVAIYFNILTKPRLDGKPG